MANKSFVPLAALLLLAWAGTAISQQSKVPPEVWEKARTMGIVRVIVGLKVPWQPEGKLSEQERLAQRQAIAAAQEELLADLAATNHRVTRRFRTIPSIGLEVGADAMEILERSSRVGTITEDRPVGLPQKPTVPDTK